MKLPGEFYNQLRMALRISDIVRQKVALTKKGGEFLGICPFHSEKTPSFTVNDAKRFYHCFGCGAHGDIIRFVAETSGLSYTESAIKIAQENGIELPKMSLAEQRLHEESEQLHTILELASQFFVSKLGDEVIQYLINRGINQATIKDFAIGYAPGNGELEKFFKQKSIPIKDLLKCGLFGKRENGQTYEVFNKRIMFPIRNTYNKVVAFGGRSLGDMMPKYINSPETAIFKKSEIMFGENVATSHFYKDNYAIVVEGYMDVIALHQAGFKQAVASLGTSVTEGHIKKLWRTCDEIIACLDGDSAGIRASNKVIELTLPAISASKSVSFIGLQSGLDPDDLIKSGGPKAFNKALLNRIGLSEMIWKTEAQGKSFNTPESRSTLEKKLEGYCALINDNTLRANFRRYFKDMIWQHIIKNKNLKPYIKPQLSSELLSAKHYTEIEFAEHAICAFMVKFPSIACSIAENIRLSDPNLNELKDWISDFVSREQDATNDRLEEEIKNSRFYNTYLVLFGSNNLFLDTTFSNKEGVNQELVFERLCKKHYLLLLKQEYIEVSRNGDDKAGSKSSSYLKEIQKVSKELNKLSENFIN